MYLGADCGQWKWRYNGEMKAPSVSADCIAQTSFPPQLLWEYVLAVGGHNSFQWPRSEKREKKSPLSQRRPLKPPSTCWPACFIFHPMCHFNLMKFRSITGRPDINAAGKVFSYLTGMTSDVNVLFICYLDRVVWFQSHQNAVDLLCGVGANLSTV